MNVFIKFNEDGWVTDWAKEATDGYAEVYLPDSWISDFVKWADKFRYDTEPETPRLLHPGNTPELTVADVNAKVADQATTITQIQQSVTSIAIGLATKGVE